MDNTYEVSMEFFGDPESYREHVFTAPSDEAAVMHGLRWPGLNGWCTATRIDVARYFPPKVNDMGVVTSPGVRSVIAENHMIEPALWVGMADNNIASHARGLIARERRHVEEEN